VACEGDGYGFGGEEPLDGEGGRAASSAARAAAAAAGGGPSTAFLLWARYKPLSCEWLPTYKWRRHLRGDVVAGVTIGVLLVPQGLACAALAGVPPLYGIYAGLPAALYAALGSSRQGAVGPMSIPSLLIATGLAEAYGGGAAPPPPPAVYAARVASVTLLSGALLLAMGWAGLAFLMRFVSMPVLSGFTTASAVLAILSVAKDLLGAPVARAQVLQDHVRAIVEALPLANGATLAVSALSFLAVHLMARARARSPLAARVLAFAPPPLLLAAGSMAFTAVVMAAARDGGGGPHAFATAAGVALTGAVPQALPAPAVPAPLLSVADVRALLPTAATVALVGFVESAAVAKMYALKHEYEVSINTELKAVGATNVAGALVVQSLPVMCAFGRSAVNDAAGARTQVSGVVSAVTVLALLVVAMPALFYLPRAVLAATIVVSVAGLVDVAGAARLWRVARADFFVMCGAASATLFLGVTLGMGVSTCLSLAVFVALASQPRVEELGRLSGTVVYKHLGMPGVVPVPRLKILRFLAPLFFANVSVLKDRVLRELMLREGLPPLLKWHALIICCAAMSQVDATALQVLGECAHECRSRGAVLLLASVNAYVERAMRSSGLLLLLAGGARAGVAGGDAFIHRRVHDAVRAVLLKKVPLPAPAPPDEDSPREAPARSVSLVVRGRALFTLRY
jgi:SulP family sulfate permease